MMHSKVTRSFKVFSQNLGALFLINQPTSMRSELMGTVKVVGHKAEIWAYSRTGGSRGRSRRVVRCSCSSCYCSSPLCLQEALVLEQASQVWIRSKGKVRVRSKCHCLSALLLMLRCKLPPGVPCEAVRALGRSLCWARMETFRPRAHHKTWWCTSQISINGSRAIQQRKVWIWSWGRKGNTWCGC